MNSVQTMTLNSALSQNWVVCTVRTPRNQVTRTLRAQCPCRGRCSEHNKLVARMSRAQPAQVTRLLGVRWSQHSQEACPRSRPKTQVATRPGSLPQVATQNLGRDTQFQQAKSRPQIDVATSLFSSHRNAPVATQNLGRDIKSQQGSQNHVATSNWYRDTTQATPGRDLKTGSRHRFSSPAPSQVATPNQVTTLLEANLCRDINFMSRHRFCPQWAFQVATPKIQVTTSLLPSQNSPGRDLKIGS